MSDNQFSEASHLTDAVLVVEDKRLHVNKAVLSLATPVFDRMFHGDFKEGKTGEIPLPGKKYDDFVEFLSCIYTSSRNNVTRENMDIVMPLAEEYQVTCIKDTCDTLIETLVSLRAPSIHELVHLMYISGQYKLPKSMKKCADVAAIRKMEDLQKVKEFEQVDPEMKYRVASQRLVRYEGGCDNLERELYDLRGPIVYCTHPRSATLTCNNCKDERIYEMINKLKTFHECRGSKNKY